ncbi:MAG TPA: zinc-dependent metalloprotease [Vicinamibacteria bacterium]|nr:zinc-dependent metalloprotease [Vicinamibacteria bacterium]
MRLTSCVLLASLAGCATSSAQRAPAPAAASPLPASPAPSDIAARTARLHSQEGFLPLHWDEKEGRLLLEVPRPGEELIYQVSLPAGVGSNPVGLDRGQLGDTRLVRFDRFGPKVLLVEPPVRFRALGGSAAEVKAVSDSFASSVLWSFKVEAETGGRLLVDATDFFLRDAHGVAARLRDTQQGSYSVDAGRSAIYPPRTRAFPRNTEVEAIVTLVTRDRPGPLVSSVTPAPDTVTVRQHHSFVQLPAPGYAPRRLDPRAGVLGIEVYDYASPFAAPLEQRLVVRHRLQKKDPAAAVSEVVEPIVYYVDHAAPEPIRSALVEGASWWTDAFERAGFRGGFEVRILPEDADPMDIRYNVVNWVHRSTRGWSYGASVIDPRTGEVLKGNVSLGSLRIRQDVTLASALVPPYEGPNPEVLATLDPSVSPTEMALARIRQLAAHEVGHTIGIDHNFAASTYGDRASVMDYPAPRVRIRDGGLDLSDAYGRGLGAFDHFSVRYAYTQFPEGTDEGTALAGIVGEALQAGMLFVADEHGRDPGTAHPLAAVWDNGPDPIERLRHEMEVRRLALDRFSLSNLRPGQPLSELEPLLLPLYLHHRYQVEAALKSLGGVFFTYAVREAAGEAAGTVRPETVRRIVAPERQRDALRAALATLEPAFLAVPQRIVDLIPPPAPSWRTGTAERFERATTPLFDPIAAARASASITLGALLHPARAARLARFHAEDASNPPLTEVTGALVEQLTAAAPDERAAALRRAVRDVAAAKLMEVAGHGATDAAVRAGYEEALRDLARRLRAAPGRGAEAADRRSTSEAITRFLERPGRSREPLPVPAPPPGPPIG